MYQWKCAFLTPIPKDLQTIMLKDKALGTHSRKWRLVRFRTNWRNNHQQLQQHIELDFVSNNGLRKHIKVVMPKIIREGAVTSHKQEQETFEMANRSSGACVGLDSACRAFISMVESTAENLNLLWARTLVKGDESKVPRYVMVVVKNVRYTVRFGCNLGHSLQSYLFS